jgi:hypothetical protein
MKVVGIANCNTFTDQGIPWAIPASVVHFVAANGESHDADPSPGLGAYAVDFNNVPENGVALTANVECFLGAGPGTWSRSPTLTRNVFELQDFDLKYKW